MKFKVKQTDASKKLYDRLVASTERDLSKTNKAEARFRTAVANTAIGWLENLDEEPRKRILFSLMVAASASDRKAIAASLLVDATLETSVKAEIERRAAVAEAEAAKAEAEAAKAAAAGEPDADDDADAA
ncbi:hypothetical protein [Rubrimonas cliftonensis]|uniref:Uncharacterized protein n=1 Tax=Rubrimonas cliftonensis TaxID=89524 RepID=A0A1H4G858_9RHOB|nr:hypothetical protein [Rubrimonas cliftonensis]SEB05833.1 hypothetical protein SAMN05444370_14213 [Rubrimonas cliftonensis]